jgi:cell wall-active antibiotic response 4TMS protein YvqF
MSAMAAPNPPPPASPPPWQPPQGRRGPDVAPIIVGLVILAVGIWYFLDTTLGLQMPNIEWRDLWPVILIVIGGVILFRAASDRRR